MGAQTNAGGNFDWIAPIYDMLARVVFGRKLQQAQRVWLDQIPAEALVLIVGGGTGWILEQVLVYKPKRVVYLEASAQMLARASQRMIHQAVVGSVEFRVGDTTALLPGECFDVLITPFVLDLFSEESLQNDFIPSLLSVLTSTGLWLVTDFVNPTIGWQKVLLQTMIGFFRLVASIHVKQLANWQRCLTEAGLICIESQSQVGGMVSTEVWTKKGWPANDAD